MPATRHLLSDGRWRFCHGPIELLIDAEGDPKAIGAAHQESWQRFAGLLDELVAELALLRRPIARNSDRARAPLAGPVAQCMWRACAPFSNDFITPMAAVAGSVADAILGFYRREGIVRALVNNGGDIAFHLEAGRAYRFGLCADIARGEAAADGEVFIRAADPVRGVATSGWRGRSFSLGIADSVTVLAEDAAKADAAATMIGNAVLLNDPRIVRAPANSIQDDSDLGNLLVTRAVPALEPKARDLALSRGRRLAEQMRRQGLIWAAVLQLQGQRLLSGPRSAPGSPLDSIPIPGERVPATAEVEQFFGERA
jgi:ApbE superfamily uncharacterized protein (UPF0280 family)